jgi:hypothetical protein
MTDDEDLTNFQKVLRDKVVSFFSSTGREIAFLGRGSKETYLHAQLDEIEIWIYEDEAELRIEGEKFLHETHSEISEENLMENFMDSLASNLMQDGRYNE